MISCLATLRVKDCQLADAGEYTVTLHNEHGELSTNYRLTVLDKPQAPRDLNIESVAEDAVSLSWQPPAYDGGSPIKGYTVEKREVSRRSWHKAGTTRDTKFTVKQLMEGQTYSFQVRAENEFGFSEAVEILQPSALASLIGEIIVLYLQCVNNITM